jgi:hypothetical protein
MTEQLQERIGLLKIVNEHVLDFTSSVYSDLLTRLVEQLQSDGGRVADLVVPFALTCAAALEATLNDHLVAHFFREYGEGSYKRTSEAFLSMSFRGKLDILVPTLTHGLFRIRPEATCYQRLSKLISTRNELVHSKSFFLKGAKWVDGDDGEVRVVLGKNIRESMDAKPIRKLTASECIGYFEALKQLDTLFIYPLESNTLSENDLVALTLQT